MRKAKAEKLLAAWEESGREFDGDQGRTAELDRLLKLTDEAFAATESAVQTFAAGKKKRPEDEDDEADDAGDETSEDGKKPPFPLKKKKPKKGAAAMGASARRGGPAGSRDQNTSLEDQLTSGFMAAYEDRVGADA